MLQDFKELQMWLIQAVMCWPCTLCHVFDLDTVISCYWNKVTHVITLEVESEVSTQLITKPALGHDSEPVSSTCSLRHILIINSFSKCRIRRFNATNTKHAIRNNPKPVLPTSNLHNLLSKLMFNVLSLHCTKHWKLRWKRFNNFYVFLFPLIYYDNFVP